MKVLTPVIDLKSKQKDDDEANSNSPKVQSKTFTSSLNVRDFDWNVANEYDPMWPNDYEKVAKGIIKLDKLFTYLMGHILIVFSSVL